MVVCMYVCTYELPQPTQTLDFFFSNAHSARVAMLAVYLCRG